MAKSMAVEYRPQVIDDVVGQAGAKKELSTIFKKGKAPAAILLTGDTGLGKTTLSRIIARTLNCKEGNGCGKCSSCEIFDANPDNHPDYKEINAASQRGIDDVRTLIDLSKFRPRFGTRVIVMDECHQLTGAALEALLKDLEEPSDSTLWILATTNPEKLKQTIVDRCLHIRLTPAPTDELAKRLGKIAKKAGVKLPEAATTKIAELSGGYVRRSIAALEKLLLSMGDVSETSEKKLAKAIDEAFTETEETDIMVNAMQILALLYEGKTIPLLSVLGQVEDWSTVASRMPYMNGYILYAVAKMDNPNIKNPKAYWPSPENRQLWDAIKPDLKTPEDRFRVLSNASKAAHRLIVFRETLFSTTYPDKVSLAYTCLTQEPATYIKMEASASSGGKSGKDKKKKKGK